MRGKDFTYTVTVKSTPEKAFGDISHVSKWWATGVTGRTDGAGESFTVSFGDTWVTFRVARMVPALEIVWEVTDCHLSWLSNKTEWNGTQIVWKISSGGGKTEIHFTHAGLVPEMECYKDCSLGWTSYIQKSLRKLELVDKGLPDQF